MVRIRLMRVGKRKQPSYRVVVADSRSPRDGRIIEAIGNYHPRRQPSGVVIDTERADYWIGNGAQPSEQVRKLLEIVRSGGGGAAAPEAEAPAAARAKKATAAASVEQVSPDETADEAAPPAELPEAEDQAAAAPEDEAAAPDVEQKPPS